MNFKVKEKGKQREKVEKSRKLGKIKEKIVIGGNRGISLRLLLNLLCDQYLNKQHNKKTGFYKKELQLALVSGSSTTTLTINDCPKSSGVKYYL